MSQNQLVTILSIIAFTFMSCGDSKELQVENLNKEVLEIHDAIMPKMAEINRLKRQLKSYKDVIIDENVGLKDSVINTVLLLSKSEDAMNDWMGSYNYPNNDASAEQMIQYLVGQKNTIKSISDNIMMSMAVAKGFLKNAPDSIKNNAIKSEIKPQEQAK